MLVVDNLICPPGYIMRLAPLQLTGNNN